MNLFMLESLRICNALRPIKEPWPLLVMRQIEYIEWNGDLGKQIKCRVTCSGKRQSCSLPRWQAFRTPVKG